MVDIVHRIGAKAATPAAAYTALTTLDGLAAWWTKSTHGDGGRGGSVGDVLQFRFEAGGFDMRVRELEPARRVVWEVIDGPEEWIGTRLTWDLRQDDDYTIILFTHQGWREPVEFMHHCSTKWAVFLLSLKSLLETGDGAPEPRDVKIDNWN